MEPKLHARHRKAKRNQLRNRGGDLVLLAAQKKRHELKHVETMVINGLGGGFKYFFYFHPYLGKIPILTNIFERG